MKILIFFFFTSMLTYCQAQISHHHEGVEDSHHHRQKDLDEEDLELLERMEQIDEMIKLVRKARSVEDIEPTSNNEDDIVEDKEMVKVLGRVDLTESGNVEAVADVMKTLPGDVQLEFLMNEFMMTDESAKSSIVHHHDVSSDVVHQDHLAKREASPEPAAYGGGYFASSKVFSRPSSFSSYDDPHPEPEYHHPHPEPENYNRFRRSVDHSRVDHHEHPDSYQSHSAHGKFYKPRDVDNHEGKRF